MKKLILASFLMLVANAAIAEKVEILPTSTLKGPHGKVINSVVELSKSAGFEFTASQKNGCGEAVNYFENAKGPIAIIWSTTMIKNGLTSKQNCTINFKKAKAVAVTFAPYELCVLKGKKLEANRSYILGNNKFNPQTTILTELNKNKKGITFTNVTYSGSGPAIAGLINKEIEIAYAATGNASSAIEKGSIDCLYTTGASKYGQKPLSEFTGTDSPLNTYSLGMMLFVKNMSADQIRQLEKSLAKNFEKQMYQKDMVNSKVGINKSDFNKFYESAKLYGTYN